MLPLLALARLLAVPAVDAACCDFLRARLCRENCLEYLRKAVEHDTPCLQRDCVRLTAQHFHLLYACDLAGLPSHAVLEVLRHPDLMVHCELQARLCDCQAAPVPCLLVGLGLAANHFITCPRATWRAC